MGSGADGNVVRSAVQSDGKVVIGGAFQAVNGVTREHVARLNANGSVDTSFDPGSGPDGIVAPIAVQADGKILIGGNFQSVNGTARGGIARLNANGSVDTSFNPGSGFPDGSSIIGITVQPDGRIIVAGNFSSYNGAGRSCFVRLNSSGGLDGSFASFGTTEGGYGFASVIQPDGKIIVTGPFLSVNGVDRRTIARLNADGSVDTSFDPGSGPDSSVITAAVQPSGKIVIGGFFESFNGVARNYVARLNANGSVDTGFDPGSGADQFVNPIAVQADGNVLIGGGFISVNGVPANYIARLNGGSGKPAFFNGQTALSNGVYYLQFSSGNPFGYYSFLANPAYIYHQDLGYEYVTDAGDAKNGVYLYDFTSNTFFYTSPVFPFPYLYDFTLNTTLYYYPDPNNPGRYNTNGVRYFYNFSTGQIISK